MRDPKRIKPFCDDLAARWAQYPDLRFGQFISNFMRYLEYHKKGDIFYIEDDELMKLMDNYMG